MADKKISELTALTTPDGAEELVVNDGGTSKKITVDNIFNQDIDVTGTVTADGLTVDAASAVAVRNAGTAELKIHGNVNSSAAVPTLSFIRGTGDTAFADAYTDHQLSSSGGTFYITSGASSSSNTNATFASNGDISFYEDTGTTAKFFWDASAESLGIGTSSPSHILHINGVGRSTQSTWATSSDERVKENIVAHPEALPIVNQLQPRQFNFKSDYRADNPTETGFIAQEFEAVIPSAVTTLEREEWEIEAATTDEEGNELTPAVMDGLDEFKVLNTSCLLPLLVKAVQEQSAIIDELKQQVNSLGQA